MVARAFKKGAPILLSAPKFGLRPACPQSSSTKRHRSLSPPPDGEKNAKQSRKSKASSSSPLLILKPVGDTTRQSKAATSAKSPGRNKGKVKGRSDSDRFRTPAKRTSRDETASFAGRSSSSARRDALRNIHKRLGSPIIISTSSELSDQTLIRTTTAQIPTRRPPHPLLLVQVEAGKPAPNRSLAGKKPP